MKRIAIVGAGVTGLTAARALTEAGFLVQLFDKGRRPGGRMASRDGAAGSFDHGVQWIRATAADAEALGHPPLLQCWPAIAAKGGACGWVAAPTFNHLAQHWASALDVRCGLTVNAIARRESEHGWTLRCAETPDRFDCDALLLTLPTPQAMPLLATAGIAPDALAEVRYDPNWTLMWTPADPLPAGFSHHAGAADDSLAWIAREDLKPGRAGSPRLTVQASAAWSTEHLELAAEDAAARLIALTAQHLGMSTASHHASAHRWRYAFVQTPIGRPAVKLAKALHYASDACLGSRVGLAIEAGQAAAAAIIAGD